jgi:polyisoprenoid-binding protein YceI
MSTQPPPIVHQFPIPEGIWSVEQQHSEIGFAVKAMCGLLTVRGGFGSYDGHLDVRDDGVEGQLKIAAGSLDTGNHRRDRHLRSPDFFDAEQHPWIVFAITAATARERGLTVAGELTVGPTRLELRIPVEVEQTTDGAARLEGETCVSRAALGIAWNKLGIIRDEVALHLRITLKRAQA